MSALISKSRPDRWVDFAVASPPLTFDCCPGACSFVFLNLRARKKKMLLLSHSLSPICLHCTCAQLVRQLNEYSITLTDLENTLLFKLANSQVGCWSLQMRLVDFSNNLFPPLSCLGSQNQQSLSFVGTTYEKFLVSSPSFPLRRATS